MPFLNRNRLLPGASFLYINKVNSLVYASELLDLNCSLTFSAFCL